MKSRAQFLGILTTNSRVRGDIAVEKRTYEKLLSDLQGKISRLEDNIPVDNEVLIHVQYFGVSFWYDLASCKRVDQPQQPIQSIVINQTYGQACSEEQVTKCTMQLNTLARIHLQQNEENDLWSFARLVKVLSSETGHICDEAAVICDWFLEAEENKEHVMPTAIKCIKQITNAELGIGDKKDALQYIKRTTYL